MPTGNVEKRMVVRVDQNESTVQFSHEIRQVTKMRLVYFRLCNWDYTTRAPPVNLYLRLEDNNDIRTDLTFPNLGNPVAGTFRNITSNTIPLYYKLGRTYNDGVTSIQFPVLYGKQPKDMTWFAEDIGNCSAFRATLVDDSGPVSFTGTMYMELVFLVNYNPTSPISKEYMTSEYYRNAMNA